jgi:Methyl-accepting chemotaxis protein
MKRKLSFKNSSIRIKLIVLLLVISVVPLLIATALSITYTSRTTEAENHDTQQEIVSIYTSQIDKWIRDKAAKAETLVASHPEFAEGNADQILPLLRTIKESDNEIQNYNFINPEGAGIDISGTSIDVSDRAHFLAAKESKQTAIGDMLVSKVSNTYVFPIDVPVLDASGNLAGVIVGTVSPDTFSVLTNQIKLKESGFGYLVSGTGEYYTYPDKERIGKNISEYVTGKGAQSFIDRLLKEDSGAIAYKDENGVKTINQFETIPGTKWKLVVSVPEREVLESVNQSRNLSVIIVAVVALLTIAIAVLLSRYISNIMLTIAAFMKKVAGGNLTERLKVDSGDEIGQMKINTNAMLDAFSATVEKINESIAGVVAASEQLREATERSSSLSHDIGRTVNVIAEGTASQLSASEQTAMASEEMASGVQKIAESSNSVSEQASTVMQEVESGNEEIKHAIKQIHTISESANQTARVIEELNAHSSEIGHIVDLISDISNQTSLLSLNASIEAARAGEAGKGFAVVANEVKKLAEQTSTSVNNIAGLIGTIQTASRGASQAIVQNKQDIELGLKSMRQVEESFTGIRHAIIDVTGQVQEISAASEEMSAGTEEISASMGEMVNIAQASASNSKQVADHSSAQLKLIDEMSAATNELTRMMNDLKERAALFKVK